MKNKVCLMSLGAGLAWLLGACGGGSGACSDVAACGGSVLGNWKITGTCISTTGNISMASGLNMSCPNARVGDANVTETGTVSYKADMTFTESFNISGSVSVVLPASCLTQGTTRVTCDQLNQLFKSVGSNLGSAGSGGGLPDISCANAIGGGCSCTTAIPKQTSTNSGTYSTSGSQLTQNGNISDYCVKGDKLYLKPHQGTSMTSTMGNVGVSGQIELQKQ